MKYTIKTTYPCLIKTDKESIFLEENDNLECENEQTLYVYPQNSRQPSFLVDLQTPKDCDFYSFLSVKNQNIILLEKHLSIDIKQKESLNFGGKTCLITIGKHEICFESENKNITCEISHSCKNYQIHKLKNFACVMFQNDFYAFSVPQEKLFHFSGENLSFEKDVLSVTKKFHDLNNHEKTFNVKFDDKITFENTTFVSDENKVQDLVCFSFLQSVKAGDYAIAKNMLDDRLKNRISDEQLEEFFGLLIDILPLSTQEFLSISQKKKSYVAFELKDSKISDITLDNL